MEDTDVMSVVADDSTHICNGFTHISSSPVKNCSTPWSSKTFCDPVHGQIALHPVCVAIVDTPQFQRLRHIKQTGLLEYVYPGATHNRFGHSLGVCYLASKFIQDLREKQPELEITDTDALCVQIAGLCHDLGHGPLSHTWEQFVNANSKRREVQFKWKHEKVSANMLDYLIEENDLLSFLNKYGIGRQEIEIIKDYITGAQPKDNSKAFLSQIVNNEDSGLDVDKWDYFLRDCLYLGLPCSFEYGRLIQCSKVMVVDGRTQICFRDKVLECVYNVFRTRSKLHRLAYQHRVLKIAEEMFLDALLIADEKVTGPSGEILHLWEWSVSAAFGHGKDLYSSLEKYSMLTDCLVLSCLRYCNKPDIQPAVSLIEAIEKRSKDKSGFYQLAVQKIIPFRCDELEVLDGISKYLPRANKEVISTTSNGEYYESNTVTPVTKDDVCICVVPINWGKGNKNPVDFVHFYSKNSTITANSSIDTDVAALLPKIFEEIHVHVLCRRSDSYALQVIKCAFDKYWPRSLKNDRHF